MRKLTEEEKIANSRERKRKKAEKLTEDFMSDVNDFVQKKYGGCVPPELRSSLSILRAYYKLFTLLSLEVEELPTLVTQSRYGDICHPLVTALNSVTVRLEKALGETGLTMRSQKLMDVAVVTDEETPFEKFLKGNE